MSCIFWGSESEKPFLSVSETLTRDGGGGLQFVLINVGEERLWGVILNYMAALGHKTSSTLDGSNTEYIFVKTENKCCMKKNSFHTWTEIV